jgi:hypothetical protein
MPESEPAAFATFDEAKRYLIEAMKQAEEEAGDEETAESICHAAEDANLESGPFTTRTLGQYVYWVARV